MLRDYFMVANGTILLGFSALIYLTNCFGPMLHLPKQINHLGVQVQDELAQQKYGFGDVDFSDFSDENRAFDVLLYSNIIAGSVLRRFSITSGDFLLNEQMEQREGDCKVFSSLTYAKFLALTELMGEPELRDQVRIVAGFVKNEKRYVPHAWMQVEIDGSWENYETTVIQGGEVRGDRIISSDLVKMVRGGMMNLSSSLTYISYQVLPDGTGESSLEFREALSFWPGVVGLFILEDRRKEEGTIEGGSKERVDLTTLDDRLILPELFYDYFEETRAQ
jgi:hypothetical protein